MKSITSKIVKSIQGHRSKESIGFLGGGQLECERISSQSVLLDEILGGGFPLGRVVEIYGSEGSGKTTVALHLLAENQSQGGISAFIDVEHALDPQYAEVIGIDKEDLIFSQPGSGEEAFELVMDIMEGKRKLSESAHLVIVIDSVAALASRDELSGEITDLKIAPVARLLSQSLRRIVSTIRETNTVLVFINQLRERIGRWGLSSYSTGGKALKYYSSVRLELMSTKKVKDREKMIGQIVRATVVKNKTAPPFQTAEFQIIWGQGIDILHSVVIFAEKYDVIKKVGGWYVFGDFKVQGIKRLIDKISTDEGLYDSLWEAIMKVKEDS